MKRLVRGHRNIGPRAVFELTGPVEHRVFALADPDRVVIDLPNTSTASSLALPEGRGEMHP